MPSRGPVLILQATGASERLVAEEGCPGASADAGLKAALAGGEK